MANHRESAMHPRRRLAPHLNPDHQPTPSQSAAAFEDVDRLKGANGMVGVISQRRRDGVITFAIIREWETVDTVTGEPRVMRGSFCPANLIEEYLKMTSMIKTRINELMAAPHKLPFALQGVRR